MRFLAHECCDNLIVKTLRANDYDVLTVQELDVGAKDEEVIKLGIREERILLTEDKDFGQLVYAHGRETLGVIFLRYAGRDREKVADVLTEFLNQQDENLKHKYITVQTDKIRINKL